MTGKIKFDAKSLIAEANRRVCSAPEPPAEAVAQIAEILKHNDASPKNRHVTYAQVHELLKQHGWDYGHDTFKKWVCARFQRASWYRK